MYRVANASDYDELSGNIKSFLFFFVRLTNEIFMNFHLYEQATPKENFTYDEEVEYSSGSDFDDDEDPDKIEVPGKF